MQQLENISNNKFEETLIKIIGESWRFTLSYKNLLVDYETNAGSVPQRFLSRLHWYEQTLPQIVSAVGISIRGDKELVGVKYDPGMAEIPLNIDEFSENDELLIEQVLEPTIIGINGVLKAGTVMLRRI